MKYDFICDPCAAYDEECNEADIPSDEGMPPIMVTVEAPISQGPRIPVCPLHGLMRRIYEPLVICMPEMNAKDVLNRHILGEGDPAPGLTREQTMVAAKAKAMSEKGPKLMGKVPNFTSFAPTAGSSGTRRNYTSD